jgi:simple sugar transport system ATP-binding protein
MGFNNDYQGKISLNNINLKSLSISQRYDGLISYVPGDRHKYAVISKETLIFNSILHDACRVPFSKYGLINNYEATNFTQKVIAHYKVEGNNLSSINLGNLSGGNQQKFVMGRELSRSHKLLIAVNPTRGIDIGSVNFIHKTLLSSVKNGQAILLVSYELDEILNLADTIGILFNGKLVTIMKNKNLSSELIGQYMLGKFDHA